MKRKRIIVRIEPRKGLWLFQWRYGVRSVAVRHKEMSTMMIDAETQRRVKADARKTGHAFYVAEMEVGRGGDIFIGDRVDTW